MVTAAVAALLWWWQREAPPEGPPTLAAAPASAPEAPRALPSLDTPAPARAPETSRPLPSAEAGPEGGSLEGRVLSAANSRPIAGAELTFQRDDGASSVHTDDYGNYRFAPGQPGSYRLAAVAAEGFLPFAPAWGRSPLTVLLADRVRLQGVDIKLSPAVPYRVRVVDRDGNPVEGALVQQRNRGVDATLLPPAPSLTDAAGEAKLVMPDEGCIDASKGNASGSAWLWAAERLSHRVQLELAESEAPRPEPAGTQRVAGRVVDARGAPVIGAQVSILVEGPGFRGRAGAGMRSAADGTFLLTRLGPGEVSLAADAPGYQDGPVVKVVPGQEAVITLNAFEGRVTGRVTDAQTGAPLLSFVVALRRANQSLQSTTEQSRAFIDPDGRYQLTQVKPGEALVVIAADGYAPTEVTVTLDAGTTRADAALRRGGALSGVVLDSKSHAPLAGAHVGVEGLRGETTAPVLRVDTTADDAGRFKLAGLGEGPVSFVVSAEGHHARLLSVPAMPRDGAGPAQTVLLTPLGEGEEPKLEFTGIGISLMPAQDGVVVTTVFPGSGAAEAGLQKGDKLLRIDGRPVTEVGFEGATTLIRGPEGSVVLLLVQRGQAPAAEVRVVRKAIRG